jgi:hypothetical protein
LGYDAALDRRKLVADAQAQSVISSLLALASKEADFKIHDFIRYYRGSDVGGFIAPI